MKLFRNFLLTCLIGILFRTGINAQVITTLYVDVMGAQPVQVDTMRSPYPKNKAFERDAEKQFAVGLRLCGLNLERHLHWGFLFAYRKVTLENLNLLDQNNVNKYEKQELFEMMGGINYFTPRGLHLGKVNCHFSANVYGGLQNFAFGSSLGGGLTFLSDKGVAGVTIEFVYRPVSYEIENRSEPFVADPYYVTLEPSYAVKLGFAFGRNLKYGD